MGCWNLPEQVSRLHVQALSGRNRGAAVEEDAIGEQQLKWTETANSSHEVDRCNQGAAAAEADAIGEQQLCTESCPAPDYSRRQMRRK